MDIVAVYTHTVYTTGKQMLEKNNILRQETH